MLVNIWLAVRNDAQTRIVERLNWDESTPYSGPVDDRSNRLFRYMQDRGTVQNLYKEYRAGTRRWRLWSITLEGSRKLKEEVDALALRYPNQLLIIGAWYIDGRQIGTQFTKDEDGLITGVSGAPTYPLHAQILRLMPDVVTYDENGDETSRTNAAEPTDVNLLMGQTPRRFA